ncbi:MAG: hypothetical protein ABI355_06845 [Solirubrobacteraceae bacterium]
MCGAERRRCADHRLVNAEVADGRLQAPVALTRDHMNGGAMTHPNFITEGMPGGSDPATAPWSC